MSEQGRAALAHQKDAVAAWRRATVLLPVGVASSEEGRAALAQPAAWKRVVMLLLAGLARLPSEGARAALAQR